LHLAPKELRRLPKQNSAKQSTRIFDCKLVAVTETKSVEIPAPIAFIRDAKVSLVDD
jgi:hypothetical protein